MEMRLDFLNLLWKYIISCNLKDTVSTCKLYQGTFLSTCRSIFFSFVYLAALVDDTSFVSLIDISNVLGVQFRTPVSVLDGAFYVNISQFYLVHATSPGVTCYVPSGFHNSPLTSTQNTSQSSVIIIITLAKVYTFKTIL